MSQPRRNKSLKVFISTVLLFFLLAYYNGEFNNFIPSPINEVMDTSNNIDPNLSDNTKIHILYGDNNGGGHKFGINKPCKSEFPKNWADEEIISSIKKIAANDNLQWKQQNNGYYITEAMDRNINIRVVIGSNKMKIITAYPINVDRNPCYANDN